jgi:outer membrane murein-binding lipoprotein Lpp
MKVAIQNPYFGQLVAETELAQRISLAAKTLGWTAAELRTGAEIKAFQPDFTIALHNNSPKLAEFPTYGCMWNPPAFFEGTEKYIKHILTYDGYLTSSKAIDRWLHHLLYATPKKFFTAPFYTSCPKTVYQPPHLDAARLMYLGSNWDGKRFPGLFEGLDTKDYMTVYGNPDGWKHLKHSYRGSLPYDGESVLRSLNQAGVGLCLHRAEHRDYALPSMRIFEIVASGAIAICGDHPFIRSAFGDSVLYLDPDASVSAQIDRISELMDWIQRNPQAAIEKSAQAHQVFLERFSLEQLLLDLLPDHQSLVQQKGFVVSPPPATVPEVQTVTVQNSSDSSFVWAGLNAVTADYFAVLEETAIVYPNHIQTLVSLLEAHPEFGVAYSGCLNPDETLLFQPFNLEQLLTFELTIPLSSLVVRRSVLDSILLQDPQLNEFSDRCLLFHLAQRTPFLFSYELTCETQKPIESHSLLKEIQDWSSELSRLKFIFWHQEFAAGTTLQSVQKAYREHQHLQSQVKQLRSQIDQFRESTRLAQEQIEAMKTSKFWQLRSAWFKVKQAIGLPTDL